jgi:hypothetical protein
MRAGNEATTALRASGGAGEGKKRIYLSVTGFRKLSLTPALSRRRERGKSAPATTISAQR